MIHKIADSTELIGHKSFLKIRGLFVMIRVFSRQN